MTKKNYAEVGFTSKFKMSSTSPDKHCRQDQCSENDDVYKLSACCDA